MTGAATATYLCALDLSGSGQGVGGVGGLLAVQTATGTFFPVSDGHGNITVYLNRDGAPVARYEYGPFGELLRESAPAKNEFRFSTKYADAETGLLYYGYRYYSADLGRWLNRDPIGELGGLGLYGFVGNDGVNATDALGLYDPDDPRFCSPVGPFRVLGNQQVPHLGGESKLGNLNDAAAGAANGVNRAYSGTVRLAVDSGFSSAFAQPPEYNFFLSPEENDQIFANHYALQSYALQHQAEFGHVLDQQDAERKRLIIAFTGANDGTFLFQASELGAEIATPTLPFLPMARNPSWLVKYFDDAPELLRQVPRLGNVRPTPLRPVVTTSMGGEFLDDAIRFSDTPLPAVKYIGRLDDLKRVPRHQTLLDELPDLGSPRLNYYQNSSVLRRAHRDGYEIRDASAFRHNSEPAPTLLRPNRTVGRTFLGAERLVLKSKGLQLTPSVAYLP